MDKIETIRQWSERNNCVVDSKRYIHVCFIHFARRSNWKSLRKLCRKHNWTCERVSAVVAAVEILPYFKGGDGASFEFSEYEDPPQDDDLPF